MAEMKERRAHEMCKVVLARNKRQSKIVRKKLSSARSVMFGNMAGKYTFAWRPNFGVHKF